MDAVIMTGGKGTRMSPYTQVLPKGLLPVGGRPILETIVKQLAHHGFRSITMTCGYLAPLIQTYFGDGKHWGISLSYTVEPQPLGTIGALRLLPPWQGPVLVMNCDILTTLDYTRFLRFHQSGDGCLTVATQRSDIPFHLGVVETNGDRVTHFAEKPRQNATVSMGIYIMEPKVLDFIPANTFFDTPELIRTLLKQGETVRHYMNDAFWMDIGRPEDYRRANKLLPERRKQLWPGDGDE